LAWRGLIEAIFEASIRRVKECVEKGVVEDCVSTLMASADALYSPLKPIDTGFGEAKRLASQLASLVADVFIYTAREARGDEFVANVYAGVSEVRRSLTTVHPVAEAILVEAVKGVTPSWAPEPREAVYMTLKDYVEPEQPQLPRRRRREPRRLDPIRDARRVLRELGRRDPILARALQDILKREGFPV
jgi:hypothetical protein